MVASFALHCMEGSVYHTIRTTYVPTKTLPSTYLRNILKTYVIRIGKLSILNVRERSFIILGTGADDFWQGYETFCYHSVGV